MRDVGMSAFPHESGIYAFGLEMRDYFAAQAMIAYMTTPVTICCDGKPIDRDPPMIVKAAYEMADMMMKEREK